MEEKRKYKRFQIQMDTKKKGWSNCSVCNVSREGLGIVMDLQERIDLLSKLQLEIATPSKGEPIKATGHLRWIKALEGNTRFMGGMKLDKIDQDDQWILFSLAW